MTIVARNRIKHWFHNDLTSHLSPYKTRFRLEGLDACEKMTPCETRTLIYYFDTSDVLRSTCHDGNQNVFKVLTFVLGAVFPYLLFIRTLAKSKCVHTLTRRTPEEQ